MKVLSKDERGFIEGIASYVRSDTRARTAVPKVQSLLTKVTAAAKREQTAQIKSAVGLTAPEKKRVETLLSKLLEHNVECHYSVDASVLGGLKIQVADWVVDSSLSSQLKGIARFIASV
jgi:ATP synthase F1 delta subunit